MCVPSSSVRLVVICIENVLGSVAQLVHECEGVLAQRPHEGIASQLNHSVDHLNGAIDQSISAAMLWGSIVDPEKDDPHVINPEQVRQICTQIFRELR